VLDVEGYYAPLLDFLDRGVAEGFVREAHRALLLVDDEPGRLLDRMAAHVPPATTAWITSAQR
jgi:predicted Rossmann-fold nucleotide-binding protein